MLLVYFILFSLMAAFIFVLARRKGQSRWFALFGYIPLVNMFCALWMASLTDQRVLERLEALEKQPAGIK